MKTTNLVETNDIRLSNATTPTPRQRFIELKLALKVGKGRNVAFKATRYSYRSKEDILEATKPLEKEFNILIKTSVKVFELAGSVFASGSACAECAITGEVIAEATDAAQYQARGEGSSMNSSQLSGSASSYATKYALGNLLGLDDNVDPDDHTNFNQTITTPKREVEVVEGTNENANYKIREKTISAKTEEDINSLVEEAKKINADDSTFSAIRVRAIQLGLAENKLTGLYVKK